MCMWLSGHKMTQRQVTWKNKAKGDARIRLASSPVRMSGVDAAAACLYLQGAEPGYFCSAHPSAGGQGLSHPYQCCTESHRFLPILWGGILDLKESYRNVFGAGLSHTIFSCLQHHICWKTRVQTSPQTICYSFPQPLLRGVVCHMKTQVTHPFVATGDKSKALSKHGWAQSVEHQVRMPLLLQRKPAVHQEVAAWLTSSTRLGYRNTKRLPVWERRVSSIFTVYLYCEFAKRV